MSDSSWDDYAAEGASADSTDGGATADYMESAAALEADVAPVLDVAATDTWKGDNAAEWGDWNAEIANDSTQYAQSELAYAEDAYAGGWTEVGDAAVARAEASADVAASHDATASDYYGTAESSYEAAADGYGTAAGYVDDAAAVSDSSSYDTTSSDTTSYDTTSYDAGSSDTTSYDTTSYDAGSTDAGSGEA